ncbi:UDP-N-acetylmuramate dehydrogenase [Sporolactobacillus putidus]|uniref:UDP-N-acetylenolpyruvoylglucosamine reductase n=1 Tax=Sporolactobacillus putidus TaxID=492735 RepID=A0A917W495_9BACL|nr:UDP-N-acetylmuramate dehydrogenase [Sporolactobacillus putidus]GGL61269.1 UDP-N-acetylenolpyruvoylglucosamine reductase [Sporolactobacillus putidus]
MNKMNVYQDLMRIVQDADRVKYDEMLSAYTFTKTGGEADVLVLPESYTEVQEIVRYTAREGIPVTVLGNGSNVIIRDGGIRGVVINLTRLSAIRLEGDHIVAQSGAAIIDVSRFALKHSLSGMEFACGIPGSIGGALYMNAGAYGGETADVLDHALVVDCSGKLLQLNHRDLQLGYRNSAISRNGYIALEGTFALTPGHEPEIKAEMDRLTYLREMKQPLEYPSCGSVFKRPPGHFAGKLIQDSGLQGTRIGGVEVSKKHAGFMVNIDHGTATDYINLIHHVQKTVKAKFNVDLETEVKIIGESRKL